MKKLLIVSFVIGLSLICIGCGKKQEDKELTLQINCNGNKNTLAIKENATFKCTLMDTEYEFTINTINDDSLIITSSDAGLSPVKETGGISLTDEIKEFTIVKGKDVKISTQTTDYNESLILNW